MSSRHGPLRRTTLVVAIVAGLVFALSAPGIALGAQVPKLPSTITPSVMAVSATGPVAIPVQGINRVATAIEASKKFGTAQSVVLATGWAFPDALGGAALAGAVDGPILLTAGGTALEADVLAEINRLGADTVYILGGTGAVSAAIETALDVDFEVVRLGGINRYATAKLIADKTIEILGDSYTGGAFIATGENYADALAASSIMYAQGMPLVLVSPTGAYTLSTGMDVVDVLGGTGVVPDSVETALGAKAGVRLAGLTRYETAIAVATHGVDKYGMSWNNLGIATGENYPDALCAGPLLDKNNSVLLMTHTASLTPATATKLAAVKASVVQYYLFGGTGVITTATRASIATALEAPVLVKHDLPAVYCTEAGCHGGSADVSGDGVWGIDDIHYGLAVSGCGSCHPPFAGAIRNCETCHVSPHAGTHVAVASTSTEACTQAGCHADSVTVVHASCSSCHNATTVLTAATTCETCHGNTEVKHATVAAHAVSGGGGCFDAYCHGGDVSKMHAIDFRGSGETPPGCSACHTGVVDEVLTTTCLGACHPTSGFGTWHNSTAGHAALKTGIETLSVECMNCHGSEVTNIVGLPADVAPEHKGCSCHAYGHAAGATSCVSCHTQHGFSQKVETFNPTGTWVPAGGHNTPLFDVAGATSVFGADGVVIKDSMGNTIEQEWPLPTAGVFWSQSNAVKQYLDPSFVTTASVAATDSPLVAMDFRGFATPEAGAAALDLEVGWDSLITCYDCHTELEGLVGPQGANVANYGLDPNFPDDWTKAELTSWDPTGMRSIETTNGGTNPYYTTLGAQIYTPDDSSVPTKANIIFGDASTATTISAGAFYNIGTPASQGYSMGNSDPKRFICQKCHKLTNSFQGQAIEGNGRGNRSNALNYMGFSNYPHMEHHGDTINGQGNCVSCHVAIPHGWKRPRLLVSERDPEPYKVQWVFEGMDNVTEAKDPAADLSEGNWGYIGPGSSSTLYGLPGALDSNGNVFETHLEKVSAGAGSVKVLEAIPQEHFLHGQHDNHEADLVYVAKGFEPLKWDTWDYTTNGVNWHADTTPGANEGHYNNCSA
ncbi:MAG: cell wall-binding repeat-containing protein, partial [Coriobacteriia bacterium]